MTYIPNSSSNNITKTHQGTITNSDLLVGPSGYTDSNIKIGNTQTHTITGSYNYNQNTQGSRYYILGEYYEPKGSVSIDVSILISSLNILGREYYDQLIKNNINFDKELDEFIQLRLKIIDRDNKIKELGIDD
jgi:hypothetical protein